MDFNDNNNYNSNSYSGIPPYGNNNSGSIGTGINFTQGYTVPSPGEQPMYQQPAPQNMYQQPLPYTYQGYPQQPYPMYMPPKQINNTPGFVLGLISIFISEMPLIGLILSVVGLILSIKSKKESSLPGNTQGSLVIPGIVCSAIGLFFSILVSALFIFALVLTINDPDISADYDNGNGYGYYHDFTWEDSADSA